MFFRKIRRATIGDFHNPVNCNTRHTEKGLPFWDSPGKIQFCKYKGLSQSGNLQCTAY